MTDRRRGAATTGQLKPVVAARILFGGNYLTDWPEDSFGFSCWCPRFAGSNELVIWMTQGTPSAVGGIGSADAAYADIYDLPVVRVRNAAGSYRLPNARSGAVALLDATEHGDGTHDLDAVHTSNRNRACPISSYNDLVIPTGNDFDADKGATLAHVEPRRGEADDRELLRQLDEILRPAPVPGRDLHDAARWQEMAQPRQEAVDSTGRRRSPKIWTARRLAPTRSGAGPTQRRSPRSLASAPPRTPRCGRPTVGGGFATRLAVSRAAASRQANGRRTAIGTVAVEPAASRLKCSIGGSPSCRRRRRRDQRQ